MGKKRNFYFPPKRTPTPITISDDVKVEIQKLAQEIVDQKERESLDRLLALTMLALHTEPTLRFGASRLNRFASQLTFVSEEMAKDGNWFHDLTRQLEAMGVEAFKGASEGKFDPPTQERKVNENGD